VYKTGVESLGKGGKKLASLRAGGISPYMKLREN
jgi:hypothetical protein